MRETLVKTEEFKDSSWESIPSGWQAYSIGELMNYIKSGLSRAITFDDIGVPVITSTNLVDSELDTTDLKYWYEKDPQGANIAAYILDDGDILLNFINSVSQIGKVCIFRDLGRPAIYTTNIFRIKPNNKVTTKFFWRLLQSNHVQHWIQLITKPAINQASFTQPEFAAIPVVIPESKEEQECITEILDTVDEAIAHTSSLIAKLKQMKAGLLHDLLTRGLDENGELRDAIAHPEQFEESPLGQIPKDWEVLKLESLLNGRPKNGYSPKEVNEWTGTLMLGLGCLTEEGFEPLQLKNAPSSDLKIRAALLNDGDFLLSRSNTRERVALAGIYCYVGVPCIYSDLMMRLSLNEKTCNRFLELLLRHFPVRRQLTGNAQGTSVSMVKISSQTVIETVVALPNLTEQARIIECVDTYDTRIRAEEAYREKLKLQKQGLMHDLLIGKVRVKNA